MTPKQNYSLMPQKYVNFSSKCFNQTVDFTLKLIFEVVRETFSKLFIDCHFGYYIISDNKIIRYYCLTPNFIKTRLGLSL